MNVQDTIYSNWALYEKNKIIIIFFIILHLNYQYKANAFGIVTVWCHKETMSKRQLKMMYTFKYKKLININYEN